MRGLREGCRLVRAWSPGGIAELEASRARLSDVGPRFLFLPGSPSSLLFSNKQEPHIHRAWTRVDRDSCSLAPKAGRARVCASRRGSDSAAAARCFLPPPSIPSFFLPLLPVLPPRRPRPLLGIPRLSVPPSILSAGN